MEYFFSAVNVVLFNFCVGPSPRIKTFFFLLSIYTEELKSHFDQIYLKEIKKFHVNQTQYHIQNICTYQYLYFLLILLRQANSFLKKNQNY